MLVHIFYSSAEGLGSQVSIVLGHKIFGRNWHLHHSTQGDHLLRNECCLMHPTFNTNKTKNLLFLTFFFFWGEGGGGGGWRGEMPNMGCKCYPQDKRQVMFNQTFLWNNPITICNIKRRNRTKIYKKEWSWLIHKIISLSLSVKKIEKTPSDFFDLQSWIPSQNWNTLTSAKIASPIVFSQSSYSF